MNKLLTVKEAAEYLRISIITLKKLIKERKIPGYKLGGKILLDFTEVEASLKNARYEK